jgi:hypothetical protein
VLHVKPPGAAPVAATLVARALAAAQDSLQGDEGEAGEAAAAVAVEEGLTLTRVDFDEGGAAAVFAKVGDDDAAEPVVMGCAPALGNPGIESGGRTRGGGNALASGSMVARPRSTLMPRTCGRRPSFKGSPLSPRAKP